jgi:fumarylpyruvate hydrolase
MIWTVPEIISELSKFYELKAGDLIYTGTPAGVGPVRRGDVLSGGIDGVGQIEIRVL